MGKNCMFIICNLKDILKERKIESRLNGMPGQSGIGGTFPSLLAHRLMSYVSYYSETVMNTIWKSNHKTFL